MNIVTPKKKTAILISGRGSNMQSLIKATNRDNFPATISLVISNNPNAPGLKIANELGVFTQKLSDKLFKSQIAFDQKLNELLELSKIEIICLAGFMRILSGWFTEKWYGKIVNIHPALLPEFKGLDTHKRVLLEGVKKHGCSVHFATAEVDSGPIIIKYGIPVFDDDDEKTLAERVLKIEHQIYPMVLAKLANNEISIDSSKSTLKAFEAEVSSLIVPSLETIVQ